MRIFVRERFVFAAPRAVERRLAAAAAEHAPRRKLAATVVAEAPTAFEQVGELRDHAQAAAVLARAAGTVAQRAPVDSHGRLQLDRFDRRVAHVALADRHRRRRAVGIGARAPAAAFDRLQHEVPVFHRIPAEERESATERPHRCGRNAIGHGIGERRQNRVDHRRQHAAPRRHRRRELRHHQVALLNLHLEGAERTFVLRFECAGEAFVGDVGAGERAGVDRAARLHRALREVDREVAAFYDHVDDDRDAFAMLHAVVVEERFGVIGAVGNLLDDQAALALGVVEDAFDRDLDRLRAVARVEFLEPAFGQRARGHLGAQIAHRRLRKADVVGDHPQHLLVGLTALVDLDLIELQPFLPRIDDRRAGTETGAIAAHVDPVRAHDRKCRRFVFEEERREDTDVVEVLSRDALVVGDHHVARREAVDPVAVHAILDHDAEIGDEVRDAADVLREQPALDVEHGAAVIANFVDHHVVRGALEVDRHLVGDRRQRAAQHFEGDRVEPDFFRYGHFAAPIVMIISPLGATRISSPGKRTVVDAYSWMTAGPLTRASGPSRSRS